MMSLKKKTIAGFLWVSSTRVASRAVTITATIVLARLLTTDDFGLLATALIFLAFSEIVGELGVTTAVIQKKDLSKIDLDTIFLFSIFLSLSTFAALFLLSPIISAFFDSPSLSPVLQVAAISVIFTGIRAVSLGLLTKEMLFKKRSLVDFVSIASGGVISIALAYSGFGVWSLVWGRIAQSILGAGLAFYYTPWKPSLHFSLSSLTSMMNFSLPNFGSQFLYFLSEKSGPFIIAKALGVNLLGHYTIAINTSYSPMAQIVNTVYQVSFPMFCKLENDKAPLSRVFCKVSFIVGFFVFPAMVGLLIVADDFIRVVLTPKWLPSLLILRVFCVVTIIASLSAAIPHVMLARHKQYVMLQYDAVCALVFPACFLAAVAFGIDAVALAYLLTRSIMAAVLYRLGLSELKLSVRDYVGSLEPAITGTAFMAACVIGYEHGIAWVDQATAATRLFGSCVVGAIAYGAFVSLCRPATVREFRSMAQTMRA